MVGVAIPCLQPGKLSPSERNWLTHSLMELSEGKSPNLYSRFVFLQIRSLVPALVPLLAECLLIQAPNHWRKENKLLTWVLHFPKWSPRSLVRSPMHLLFLDLPGELSRVLGTRSYWVKNTWEVVDIVKFLQVDIVKVLKNSRKGFCTRGRVHAQPLGRARMRPISARPLSHDRNRGR